MIGVFPVLAGGLQLTTMLAFPAEAVTDSGAVAMAVGLADGEVVEGPVPTTLVAVTLTVYTCAALSPPMVQLFTGDPMLGTL